MKRFPILSLILALALMLSAFTPAGAQAQAAPQTIVEIAAGNPNFSTLVAAVQAANLVDTLNGEGPYTVFAPTNAAFAKLGQGTINALLADPAALSKVLLYHVVPGKLMAADVVSSGQAATAAGYPVAFTTRGGKAYINNAAITTVDIQASNGVIHVIDRVILPPTMDIVDTLASRPNLKNLVTAVKTAGLVDTLKGAGPYTVFAPTDAAFSKVNPRTVRSLMGDIPAITNVLLYHVFSGSAFSGDALKLTSATMANGQDVTLANRAGSLKINGNVRVVTYNIIATNGVIHVIDTVLLPPTKNIVETLAGNTNFETLVAAVKAAGLAETLSGPGPFTVFAPTDAAFAKLGKSTIDALLKDPAALSKILLYHAVPGKVYAGDVVKLTRATTANGAEVAISVRGGQVYINNARVVFTDVRTTNGVIHVIDTVLLPPSGDIVEVASANKNLKTLVAAVQAAGLVDTLKSEGPFTIFAPTDKAFAALPAGTVEALLADPAALQKVLLYHAVAGKVFSGEAMKLSEATTVNGAPVTIQVKNGRLYINNARVTVYDVQATNGVIHVIDAVLLPPAE